MEWSSAGTHMVRFLSPLSARRLQDFFHASRQVLLRRGRRLHPPPLFRQAFLRPDRTHPWSRDLLAPAPLTRQRKTWRRRRRGRSLERRVPVRVWRVCRRRRKRAGRGTAGDRRKSTEPELFQATGYWTQMTDGDQDSKLAALEMALLDESTDPIDIPFSLLKSITGNFSQAQVIGSGGGGFGAVYKGVLPSGGIVAVKKLYEKLEILDKNFKSEVACLVGVKHKNMVRFLGHCSETQHVMMPYEGKLVCAEERQRLLCFEYLPKGCLADFLSDASCRLQWTTRYEIIKGVCEGVHYLHQQCIIHMDLKPQNILLDDNTVPRIADFGLSRCLSESKSRAITKNMIGTKGYMAPEFINMGEITFKTDIYSLGVIIMEILMGHKERSNVKEVVESWTNKFVTSKSQTALEEVKVCAEIALKCTNYDPGKRLTTCFIIGLFEKLCEVEISNRRDVATSTKGQISFASNVANELKLSLERKRKAATVSVSTGVMSTLGVKLTMAMGDKYNKHQKLLPPLNKILLPYPDPDWDRVFPHATAFPSSCQLM
ncbi:putative cysteine-rich receptor-like protein kinase 20 [Triticum urartu]|uniref:putative cysteine-rich receptor-like protein kinase 20 n=1 Tax=Triticum urartu TaxID=4572 RepID=UPI0020447202|nr:putative cysteine-rich receptor-like protein kinase 20 [Triticum urartu]